MKEYIEREPILKDIEEMLNAVRQHINITGRGSGKTLWEGIGRGIIYCSKKLLAAPAADGVNLVYCKNCKYHDKNDNHCIHPNNAVEEQVPEIGKYYRIRVTPKVEEDHFCGYGRKREDA